VTRRGGRALDAAVGVLHQHGAGQREQQVVAAEVEAAADALEQDGITVGMPLVQSQQRVGVGGAGPGPHCSARNTRLPLVPPKPNELESATCTLASRAAPGT
jgi:hypothetical protein